MSPEPIFGDPDPKLDIRCYVLVNANLPTIHGGIQGAHALAELMFKFPKETGEWADKHKTLVFLSATEKDIEGTMAYFKNKNRPFAEFREPDLDNLLTAAAFEPMDVVEGRVLFGKFKLFK